MILLFSDSFQNSVLENSASLHFNKYYAKPVARQSVVNLFIQLCPAVGEAERFFGDNSEKVTPVPIPNTVVKLLSADNTWRATAREHRTSPEQ